MVDYKNTEVLVDSELAIEVLEHLIQEKEDYGLSMAKKLNRPKSSLGNIIRGLRENGLIERSRRTKAQYYRITEKGEKFIKKRKALDQKISELKSQIVEKTEKNELDEFNI